MVGNAYHINRLAISNKKNTSTKLINEDRTKTLELLRHLLSHSSQPLVICGQDGIGKSTLLKTLQEQTMAKWSYCMIANPADLSFEKLQQAIIQEINPNIKNKHSQSISAVFQQLDRQHKKLILMIDNAGLLIPGLINEILTLAKQYSLLRVIFVLNHHELDLKSATDTAINEASLIEIPALSEAQCTEFLYQIAADPQTTITANDINDELISIVYQDTLGIPGQILAKFPRIDSDLNHTKSLKTLVLAVLILIILALCTQWFSNSDYNIKRIALTKDINTTLTNPNLPE